MTDAQQVGGSEIYLREVLPRMVGAGLSASLALPRVAALDEIAQFTAGQGVEVIRYERLSELPTPRRANLVQAWRAASYADFERHLRGPRISILHDQLYLRHPFRWMIEANRRRIHRFFRPAWSRLDHVITVSRWASEYLAEEFGIRAEWVANGVDPARFHPVTPVGRARLRGELGMNRRTLVTPGRIAWEKNQMMIPFVARYCPETDFWIIGSAQLPNVFRHVPAPNVRWLGRRSNVHEYLQAADGFLLMTRGENQSLATLEAIACGCPVITSDIPAQREIVPLAAGQTVPITIRDTVRAIQQLTPVDPQPVRSWEDVARDLRARLDIF